MRFPSTLSRFALAGAAALLGALPLAPAARADNYEVDGSHSMVLFAVSHLGVSRTWGQFATVAGKLELDGGATDSGSVTLEVDAASLYTANRKRDEHLRGPDFFKVKEFPKITFVGKTNGKKSEAGFEVEGELTLLGKTQKVTIVMRHLGAGKDPWGGFRAGYEGKLTVKRSAFGMNYMPEAIGDDVELTIAVEAIKK